MATSNAYKPGWRSRRRSRLSLVERAVPRLGRISTPENKPQTEEPSAALKPSTFDADQKVNGDSQDHSEASLPPLPPDEQSKEQANPSRTALPSRLGLPSLPSPESQEQKEQSGAAETEEISLNPDNDEEANARADQDVDIELGTDALISGDAPSLDEADLQALSKNFAPTHDEPLVSETSKPGIGSRVIEGSWNKENAPTAASTRTDKREIQLDWETLVASGLVDPRDRGRPLPADMDEIARALVRQALSDQSSWRDRIILVSSAREGRAKSMAALNFAFALTTIDQHSVVLLDANMDGSGAGRHTGAPGHPGLTTALCDSTAEIDDITLGTNLDRLTLVASGAYEEDILDRFASRRMLEILRFLTKDPETLLVLDAPPILSSQEAAVLSVIAGQVVLVVESGTTDETSINQALKRIGDRHNVSLVLSAHAGIPYDELAEEQTPANDEFPLPLPRNSTSKRRVRRAIASSALCFVLGLNIMLLGGQRLSDQHQNVNPLIETPIPERSTFKMKPIAPQTSSVVR